MISRAAACGLRLGPDVFFPLLEAALDIIHHCIHAVALMLYQRGADKRHVASRELRQQAYRILCLLAHQLHAYAPDDRSEGNPLNHVENSLDSQQMTLTLQ